jgi:hypothetical protein
MTLWTWLFRRRQLENELDEELRTHLNMATAERVARGEPAADCVSSVHIAARRSVNVYVSASARFDARSRRQACGHQTSIMMESRT